MLSATQAARMTRTTRIANCPDVCRLALTKRVHRAARHPEGEPDREPGDQGEHREHERGEPRLALPRKIEIAMSGPNSPTAPIAPTA